MSGSSTSRPLRIGAYGFFGAGNLGNEGSLAAFLTQMRAAFPSAHISCFGADPSAVTREHGIPAVQLMAYRAELGATGRRVLATKVLSRLVDIPRTMWLVGRVDVLVVPGTGVLESSLMSTPWGLPYWMYLAVASCRLRGRKVALVSVGAEPAPHPATRRLFRGIVRMADYVSYRDAASAEAARSMDDGDVTTTVFPDLAFALARPSDVPMEPGHVAIGVMTFLGSTDDPGRGPEVLDAYEDNMVRAITDLADAGRTVTLLVGDRADRGLANRIRDRVQDQRPDLGPGVVTASAADDLDGLMREMARAEVVVASRFHNVICGLKIPRPTISLGYARKNLDLLTAFGLASFSQPMDSFDPGRLVEHVIQATQARPEMEPHMLDTLRRLDGELAEQLARLSEAVFEPALRTRRIR